MIRLVCEHLLRNLICGRPANLPLSSLIPAVDSLIISGFCLQLFGFVERYGGPASAVKTNKENQKLAGLQDFLLTLQQGSDKEGEFRHPLLVHMWAE